MTTGVTVPVPQIHNKPMLNCMNKRNQKLKTILKPSLVRANLFGVFFPHILDIIINK